MNLRQHKTVSLKNNLIKRKLNKLNKKYKDEKMKYDTAYYSYLQSLQDKCKHEHLVLKGHDSHKDYFVCQICEKEIWV